MNVCSVCAGAGKPLNDSPCICKGLGTETAEAQGLRELAFKLQEDINASAGLKCPNCNDVGFYDYEESDGYVMQSQCEFCYTIPDSLFNRRNQNE